MQAAIKVSFSTASDAIFRATISCYLEAVQLKPFSLSYPEESQKLFEEPMHPLWGSAVKADNQNGLPVGTVWRAKTLSFDFESSSLLNDFVGTLVQDVEGILAPIIKNHRKKVEEMIGVGPSSQFFPLIF